MIERHSIPAWGTPPRTLEDWSRELGEGCVIDKEPDGTAWIELDPLQVRGFALVEGGTVVAIDFEIDGLDPSAALDRLESASIALGWELYEDDDDDDN